MRIPNAGWSPMATAETLNARIERVHQRYSAHFAGLPRISRDLELLAQLVDEVETLTTEAEAQNEPQLLNQLQERLAMYRREAEAIRTAQADGPGALEAHLLVTWAQFAYGRYRRHFAGQSRSTRDPGLLAELVTDLEQLDVELAELGKRAAAESLERSRTELAESLKLYRGERTAIAAARGAGTLQNQADILAVVANGLFRVYAGHFANKPRLSRRPARLASIVTSLEQARDRMSALQSQGLHSDSNERNLTIVEQRLELYQRELETVRRTREKTSMEALARGLGDAANAVFDEYRGKFAGEDRATRDLSLLNLLFEQLHDIGRQMRDLDSVVDDPNNAHNLTVVTDRLRLLDREDRLIREAQAKDS